MIDPGQPWVRINGSAPSCADFTWMNWMSCPSISVLNCGSAFSLASHRAPVVIDRPIVGQRLDRRQLHALRTVRDQLLGGPPHRRDPPTQLNQILFRNGDLKGPHARALGGCPWACRRSGHLFLLGWCSGVRRAGPELLLVHQGPAQAGPGAPVCALVVSTRLTGPSPCAP